MQSTSGAEPLGHQPQLQEKPESRKSTVSFQGATPPSLPPPLTRSGKLSIDDITKFFSLPIAEAASILGVSDSVLKRICRENGIIRWPYRKFLAGKTVEIINKDTSREKTKEVDELSSGSHKENRAQGLMQNSNKLQQGLHMPGQVFQIQGNKLVQYGWSGIPQPSQTKTISTYMDEFEFGFPSYDLSSVSVKWWMDSGSKDSRMLLGQSVDSKQDQKEACLVANETNSSYTVDEESDGNLEDSAMLHEPSAHLCLLRKRSAEYGQEALEDRISKEWGSSRLTTSQRLLLSQVFEASLPKK